MRTAIAGAVAQAKGDCLADLTRYACFRMQSHILYKRCVQPSDIYTHIRASTACGNDIVCLDGLGNTSARGKVLSRVAAVRNTDDASASVPIRSCEIKEQRIVVILRVAQPCLKMLTSPSEAAVYIGCHITLWPYIGMASFSLFHRIVDTGLSSTCFGKYDDVHLSKLHENHLIRGHCCA